MHLKWLICVIVSNSAETQVFETCSKCSFLDFTRNYTVGSGAFCLNLGVAHLRDVPKLYIPIFKPWPRSGLKTHRSLVIRMLQLLVSLNCAPNFAGLKGSVKTKRTFWPFLPLKHPRKQQKPRQLCLFSMIYSITLSVSKSAFLGSCWLNAGAGQSRRAIMSPQETWWLALNWFQ